MIRSILVCTDGSPHGDAAREYAISLTQQLNARLIGLHVLDSRMLEGPLLADISGWVGAQPFGDQLQQFRELMEKKGETVIQAFNSRCEEAGVKAEALVKMGHPPKIILEEEARAELLILGQKGEHAEWIGDMSGSVVERVVRHSIKPCMITPDVFRPITRIMVAYDGSAHASQALHEATELAQALKAELTILTATETDEQKWANEVSGDALELVKAHGMQARNLVVTGKPASAILENASDNLCDLIVVGAYGHSRIREMILGSTTMHIITKSNVPVMLVR